MNLRQLYYFKELAQQKQFLKAAKNLNISQPSLSNSLKSLETELGCQLINRNNGKVFLTKYGEIFYQAAVSSVSSIENAKIKIKQQKLQSNHTISITCYPLLFETFLLPHIQEYQKSFSANNTQFIFHDDLSSTICSDIRAGKFDLGFGPKESNFNDLEFIPIFQEQLVALVRKDHPLAEKNMISFRDLTNYTINTYSLSTSLGKEINKKLLNQNKKIKVINNSNDDLSLMTTTIINNTVSIVMSNSIINSSNLVKIPLDTKPICTFYLIKNSTVTQSKEIIKFINFLQENEI